MLVLEKVGGLFLGEAVGVCRWALNNCHTYVGCGLISSVRLETEADQTQSDTNSSDPASLPGHDDQILIPTEEL